MDTAQNCSSIEELERDITKKMLLEKKRRLQEWRMNDGCACIDKVSMDRAELCSSIEELETDIMRKTLLGKKRRLQEWRMNDECV